MQRPDVFATLLAILMLGAGAYFSTFPAQVVRSLGIVLTLISAFGLVLWFAWNKRRPAILIRLAGVLLRQAGDHSSAAPAPSSQLAAHLFADPQSQEEKAYGIYWGPPHWIYGWFGDNESRNAGLSVPTEKTVSVYFTNLGPGDVRRVKIDWTLNSPSIAALIEESGLFAGRLTELGENHLLFCVVHSGGATNSGGKSFALNDHNDIPLIAEHGTQRALLPPLVTEALFLNALATATMIEVRARKADARDYGGLANINAPMPSISLTLSYENGAGTTAEQKFLISGYITPSNGAPKDGFSYQFDGIGAALRHLSMTQQ